MNFLVKNLGWILLFLFFFFMIYIIGTNNQKIQTGSGSNMTGTIITEVEDQNKENLDNLVKKTLDDGGNIVVAEKTDVDPSIRTISVGADGQALGSGALGRYLSNIDSGIGVQGMSLFNLLGFGKNKDGEIETQTGTGVLIDVTVSEDAKEVIQELEEDIKKDPELVQEVALWEGSLFSKIIGRFGGKDVAVDVTETGSGAQVAIITTGEGEETDTETTPETNTDATGTVTTNVDETDLITENNSTENTSQGDVLQKNTGNSYNVNYNDIYAYAPEIFHKPTPKPKPKPKPVMHYPGEHLQTAVGKQFEIGVPGLYLNNANFDAHKLGTLIKGDTIKQLTAEDEYGCFEVEVLASANTANVGKKGYVCKKYLQEASEQVDTDITETGTGAENLTPITPEVDPIIDFPHSQVGDLIMIEVPAVDLDGTPIVAGDVVDQMSAIDGKGCFTAHVYSASNPSAVGKIGTLCYGDIK